MLIEKSEVFFDEFALWLARGRPRAATAGAADCLSFQRCPAALDALVLGRA